MSEEVNNVTESAEVESTQEAVEASVEAPSSAPKEDLLSTSDATKTVEGSFLENLSEDLRGEASLKDFKSVEDLAKSYIHQSKMVGGSIRIPGEDAGEEQWNEFYSKFQNVPGLMRAPDFDNPESMEQVFNKLGRPETPEGYNIELPEDVVAIEGDEIQAFYKQAHELGLTKKQVEAMVNSRAEDIRGQMAQAEKAREAAEMQLKTQWGPDYENRLAGAKLALKHYSKEHGDAVNQLLQSGASNNPALITILSEMGQMLQESGHIAGEGTVKYGTSPKEAIATIDEIRGNKSHPYHNKQDPEHQAAVEKVQKLYEIAYSRN